MKAVIISIGDEILIGQILNTNSSWIAEHLNLLGISVSEMISISDNRNHIIDSLKRYEGRVDLIISTGGLGPTSDDITKSTIAEFFDSELVENPVVLSDIYNLFKKRGMKVTAPNIKQALVPTGCTILNNPSGTAPGMWFEKSGTIFVFLPGVPYEMMDIFNGPLINKLSGFLDGMVIIHQTILTQGIPESYLAERIKDWEMSLPSYIKLAYLPRPGIVRLRLTGIGEDRKKLEDQVNEEVIKLRSILTEDIYGTNDDTLESVIGRILRENNATLCTAESCTGGYIAGLITSIPGSSDYFHGSIVAYSNKVKVQQLGVDTKLIEKNGAVSREVVEKMAEGARKIFQSDYSISTSGIAGPGGATPGKPVGTTWIAVASDKKCISKCYSFGEHRGRNIEKASYTALNMLRKLILSLQGPY